CPGLLGHGDDVLGRLRVRHHDSLLGAGPSTDGDVPRVGRWRDGSVTRALTLRYESPRKGAGPALSRRPLCAGGDGWNLVLAAPAPFAVVLSGRPHPNPRRVALHERGRYRSAEGDKSQRGDEVRGGDPCVHGRDIGRGARHRAEPVGVISDWSRRTRSSDQEGGGTPKG